MEELPTVEKMKYLALRIYNTWKCPFCEQYDETFDHLWTCNSRINEIKEIINEIKQFIKNTSNMLLINEEKIPTVTESAVDFINCWDITFSNSKITFIDLIKGIIPCELTKFVEEYFNIKNTRLTFLKELRDFIFEKIWAFWINRCVIQKEKEKNAGINKKLLKNNFNQNRNDYIDINRKIDTLNLFEGLESIRSNIYFGTNLQDFIMVVNYALVLLIFWGVRR
ncbi:hypothetical protein RhiirC2_799642 [Rhizophagus irregularis]|uniref:Uncharacterized protein n=1 Tax=Rhizophagus irregularis TaxID=588596 RepID=A0A2N1M4U0_9GLOM|nr:hypothetical protein RhiirC2_799642 [Rhizophagus irregularis]